MISVNSYFSGAGLMDVGLLQSGLQINQAFELDAAACAVYEDNIGSHIKHCDLTQELVLEQDSCDGFVFTYPCTKYSPIATVSGSRTGDELFLHAVRHIAIASPEFYVIENVPGMTVFPLVMESVTRLNGYYTQVFCPIKSSTWLPQKRDRLIIIGTKKPFVFNAPDIGKPITLTSILEKSPDVTFPKAIFARLNGVYRDKPIISDPAKGDIAPCAVAHYSRDKSTRLVVDKRFPLGVRPYSVREYARLQGLPDDFSFDTVSNTNAYKQIGNGVSVPVGKWVGEEMKRYYRYFAKCSNLRSGSGQLSFI
ncbi:MAG: DNA cytosine methyltransferase [Pseudomonadota bacterium]